MQDSVHTPAPSERQEVQLTQATRWGLWSLQWQGSYSSCKRREGLWWKEEGQVLTEGFIGKCRRSFLFGGSRGKADGINSKFGDGQVYGLGGNFPKWRKAPCDVPGLVMKWQLTHLEKRGGRGPGPGTIVSVASVSSVFGVRDFSRKKNLQPILLCCNSRRPTATCLFSRVKSKTCF